MSPKPGKPEPTPARELDELWRRALGDELRRMRNARGERLDDTAARAGISPQYLSEVERGRKDPSSEMIAAVVGALESTLADVLVRVSRELDASHAHVIDIRSTTRLTMSENPQLGIRRSEAALSIAA